MSWHKLIRCLVTLSPCHLVTLSLFLVAPAAAQQVEWRYDYDTARREASQSGKPLVIDFSTTPCYWCDRLDQTTFRDPAIAQLLNEKFIPLKVDASRDARLVDALKIGVYPTIVLAGPDGKILSTIEGFKEAAPFNDFLQRALAAVSNPDWMARDYQEAGKAIGASDYARAIALLRAIVEDKGDRPIQVQSRQLLDDLEQQATGRLTRAKGLVDKGQMTEAIEVVTEMVRIFAGTQAALEGGRMLTQWASRPEIKEQPRVRRARELLAQAREDYRTQHYLCCLERCELLSASFGDLAEGTEAAQMASEIKNNPEWMRQACDTLSERLGGLYLSLAETWLKKGQPQQAVMCLERVVQTFPGSRQAEAAQTRLGQIQGQPTRPVDFKR